MKILCFTKRLPNGYPFVMLYKLSNFLVTLRILKMNTVKRRERMALTLNPEMRSLLGELAELQNKTMVTVVAESLEAAKPALEAMRNALQDLKQGVVKEQVLARMLSHSLRGVADNLELDLKQNLK